MAAVNGLPPPPPPSAGAGPSNSVPSEDDKRRRAERERRRSQSQRQAPDARSSRVAPPTTVSRVDNWLKRETPFVCDVRFRNDLPEVPCDPKMLVAPLNTGQLAAFKLTTLERDPKRDLVLEPDLGIPLSVFDIERYSVPAVAPPLAPEDKALLEGDDDVVIDASPSVRVRQRLKGAKAELSWLMRTTYISNDASEKARQQGIPEKQIKAMRDQAAAAAAPAADPLQAQIDSIQASFEAARAPPVHQKNPSLQPVEVLPGAERELTLGLLRLLPDEERWPVECVQLVFDGEPTAPADVPAMRGKPPEQRRRFAERAVGKPYRLTEEGRPDIMFLALLLPASDPAEPRDANGAGPSDGDVTELVWSREYNYTTPQPDQDFVFDFDPESGSVKYTSMDLKLTATARNSRQREETRKRFAKPASPSIKRRLPDEDEQAERTKRLRILNTGYDDEEAAEEAAPAEEHLEQQPQQDHGAGGGEDVADGGADIGAQEVDDAAEEEEYS